MKVEPKVKVLQHIGFWVEGEVIVNLWGGGTGRLDMKPIKILHPEKTYEELINDIIPQGINDGGFGVESFVSAEIEIYTLFERDVKDYELCTEIVPTPERPFLCGEFKDGINASIKL